MKLSRTILSKINPLTLAEKITGRPMAEGTRHFFKDSIFYSIANFIPRLMGLFVWPIITLLIHPEGYAVYSNYITAITAISVILSAQVELSVARYFYENKDDFPEFISTQFFFTLGLSLIMFVQFWIFRRVWASWFVVPVFVLLCALVTAMAQIVHQVFMQLLLARKESLRFLAFSLAKQDLYVIAVIAILLFFAQYRWVPAPDHYMALVYAHLLSTALLAAIFLYYIVKMMRPAFRLDHLSYALRLALPGVPGALALCTLNYFDRIMISHKSLDLAGQYSFAYQIGMLIMMMTSGVFSAYMPRFYENRNEGRFEQIQLLFSRNLKLLLLAAIGLTLASKPVAMILGRKAWFGGLPIIPIIITGYLFMYLGQCYGLYIAYRRKFILLQSISLILAGLSNIVLNVWLLPIFHYDVRIAAMNTLIPYLIQWLMVWAIARYLLKEQTTTFKGTKILCAVYLAFAAAWCLVGY